MSELNTEQKLAHESMILSSNVKSWWVLQILQPFEKLFLTLHLTPNHITYLATLLTIPCGLLLAKGMMLTGGWITLIVGSLDILDGKLARAMHLDSKRGEFLDSVLDRVQDFFILSGLLIYFKHHWIFWVVLLNIGVSPLISYIKAKSEIVGVDLKRVGVMQRPERFFTLSAGLLISGALEIAIDEFSRFDGVPDHVILKVILIFLGVMSVYTAMERMKKSLQDLS